jgi:hypothetical protein
LLVEDWEEETNYWLQSTGTASGVEQGFRIRSVQQYLLLG